MGARRKCKKAIAEDAHAPFVTHTPYDIAKAVPFTATRGGGR